MAHRPGHNSFDSTTFRRMKDKFDEEGNLIPRKKKHKAK